MCFFLYSFLYVMCHTLVSCLCASCIVTAALLCYLCMAVQRAVCSTALHYFDRQALATLRSSIFSASMGELQCGSASTTLTLSTPRPMPGWASQTLTCPHVGQSLVIAHAGLTDKPGCQPYHWPSGLLQITSVLAIAISSIQKPAASIASRIFSPPIVPVKPNLCCVPFACAGVTCLIMCAVG